MTTNKTDPTPQQQKVLDLLGQGKSADEIAKTLKITRNGVYAHKRRLRAAGHLPAKSKAKRSKATSRPRRRRTALSPNGGPVFATIDKDVKHAIETIDGRQTAIGTEQEAIKQEIATLNERSEKLSSEAKALEDQRGTLSTVAVPF